MVKPTHNTRNACSNYTKIASFRLAIIKKLDNTVLSGCGQRISLKNCCWDYKSV